jgi:hypothetical protein
MITTFLFFIGILVLLTITIMPNVYSSGPRYDYSDDYADIPGAPQCWIDGYDAGFAGIYDQERADECKYEIAGDQYNAVWMHGCEDAHSEVECVYFMNHSEDLGEVGHELLEDANSGKCWNDGISDGLDMTFDHDRSNGCSEYHSLYRHGFITGCEINGADKSICEAYINTFYLVR